LTNKEYHANIYMEMRKMNNVMRKENSLKKGYETFTEYIDVSKKTVESYKNGIRALLEYFELNNIINPTRQDIKNFRNELLCNYSSNTVNSYMTSIREFFKYLETMKIYENIADGIKGAKVSRTPKKQVLSKQQIVNIYHSLTDKREKALFSLLVTTGLRGIEVANAMLEDLKYYNGEMTLWIKCKGYSQKDQYVKISDKVYEDIKEYVGDRKTGYLFVGNGKNNNGKQLTTKTIRLTIKNIFKRFNLDDDGFSLHSTRRTFATIAYENGADIYSIQQVLHHANISTTTIYLNSADRNKNNIEYTVSDCLS